MFAKEDHCFTCKQSFNFVKRRHHCRNCFRSFCRDCCSNFIHIARLDADGPVRVCDPCTVVLQPSQSRKYLSSKNVLALKHTPKNHELASAENKEPSEKKPRIKLPKDSVDDEIGYGTVWFESVKASKPKPAITKGLQFIASKLTGGFEQRWEASNKLLWDAELSFLSPIKSPLDYASKRLGRLWFKVSGAEKKKSKAELSYFEYLSENSVDLLLEEDLKIIRKDVMDGRTDPDIFDQPTTARFISQLCGKFRRNAQSNFGRNDMKSSLSSPISTRSPSPTANRLQTVSEETFPPADFSSNDLQLSAEVGKAQTARYRQGISNVLTAYIRRNVQIGYSQGMSSIVALFLCMMDEETAFWLFCAVVEDLRLKDFYSRPPAMMNGFHVDNEVCYRLALKLFSERFPTEILNSDQDKLKFQNTIQLLNTKWLVPLFVDALPLDTMLYVIHKFFMLGGDVASIISVLALISVGIDIIHESKEDNDDWMMNLYPTILSRAKSLPVHELQKSFTDIRLRISDEEIHRLRDECRKTISMQWTQNDQYLSRLAKNTSCMKIHEFPCLIEDLLVTKQQLEMFQRNFRELISENAKDVKEGLNKTQFFELLKQSHVHLDKDTSARIFDIVDGDGSGIVDFREVICFLSILSSNSLEEKLKLCFSVYDKDKSGFLSIDEISVMAFSFVMMRNFQAEQRSSVADSQAVQEAVQRFVDKLFQMDLNGDRRLSFAEFHQAVQTEPAILECFSIHNNLLDDKYKNVDKVKGIRSKGNAAPSIFSLEFCSML